MTVCTGVPVLLKAKLLVAEFLIAQNCLLLCVIEDDHSDDDHDDHDHDDGEGGDDTTFTFTLLFDSDLDDWRHDNNDEDNGYDSAKIL